MFAKNLTESGELDQEQARFYQQKHSHLPELSQKQQQQISNIHQHQTIDFQIQGEHSLYLKKILSYEN